MTIRRVWRISGLALLAALVAMASSCKEGNEQFDPDPVAGDGCDEGREVAQLEESFEDPGMVDVLFVVSDAPGSESLQRRLSTAIPRFIALLDSDGLDYQIGVTSGDARSAASAGSLRVGGAGVAGCENPTRIVTPADGELAARYAACNALVGTRGPQLQQPLAAAVAALGSRASEPDDTGGNFTFFRPRARLLVIFVTDRDDCSGNAAGIEGDDAQSVATRCAQSSESLSPVSGDPSAFTETLRALKLDPESVAVAVIGGSDDGRDTGEGELLEPACTDADGASVYPATRLIALVDTLHPRSVFEPACAGSFGVSIAHVSRLAEPTAFVVCARHEMLGTPLGVDVIDGDKRTEVAAGVDGFVFIGPTDACPDGAVAISPEVLESGDASVELRYCTP
jgi:hypothetical protein